MILLNSNWARKTVVSDNKFVFSNCEKHIVLWAEKIYGAKCFHFYSLNVRLQKDKFSRRHFKKIIRNLSSTISFDQGWWLGHFLTSCHKWNLRFQEGVVHHPSINIVNSNTHAETKLEPARSSRPSWTKLEISILKF